MLSHLSVRNLAIIDHLEVSFGPGMNVISGETGAGKSILLGAVHLLMGSRAAASLVREGAAEAVVDGAFELPEANELAALAEEYDLDLGSEVVLGRVVTATGRTRAYVNNRLVNLSVLSDLGFRVLSISGQHESQRLLREEEQLYLLDRFGGLEEARAAVSEGHGRLSFLTAELERLRRLTQDRDQRLELLSFQVQEIDQARLSPGEEEALEAEHHRLRHAEQLAQGAGEAYQTLYGDDHSAVSLLGLSRAEVQRLTRLDSGLEPVLGRLEEASYVLEDAARELQAYADQVVFDPRRQAEVEERLTLLRRLVRKYAPEQGIEAVLSAAERMRQELAALKNLDLEMSGLEKEAAAARRELERAAEALSRQRAAAAARMAAAVEAELRDLGLAGACFEVALSRRPGPVGPEGVDQVLFQLSANPGESLKPLSHVASGGELSRITLALKSILARREAVETVVFDEVDAGIGGRVAEVVGRKLRQLAARHQIICITHLPQIAAFGQTHLRVVKVPSGKRSVSQIQPLDKEERVAELARMLGGAVMTDKALAHAREMLASASRG